MILSTPSKSKVLRHEACPKCRKMGRDNSGDNLAIYLDENGEESAHCFSCKFTIPSSEYKNDNYETRYNYEMHMSGELTIEGWERLKNTSSINPRGWRGLSEDICNKYGVRHQYGDDGAIKYQYYPITKSGELSGVKYRTADKKWNNRGTADSTCDLFGQVSFTSSSKRAVIISSGEIDALSIYKALYDYNNSTGKNWETPPVVCGVAGEGSYRQYQNHYDWLNSFDKIYVCPDQDEPGMEHLEKVVNVLPRNKVLIMDLPYKDANECLKKNKPNVIVDAYFKARSYTPSGIIGSDVLQDALLDGIRKTKIPLPPFLNTLSEMLRGGIRLPSIVNIVGPTGIGKALAMDAKVLTKDGWKLNKDLTLDDMVITPKNTYSKILGIYDHKDKPFYEFRLNTGRVISSSEDHLWCVTCVDKTKVLHSNIVMTTKEISEAINKDFYSINIPLSSCIDIVDGFNVAQRKARLEELYKDFNGSQYIFSSDSLAKEASDILFSLGIYNIYYTHDNRFIISIFKNEVFDQIQSVRKIENKDCRCIMIEDEDHLYLTDNFVVTHNTTYVNELLYFWMFQSPYMMGILSLEADRSEYANVIASKHLKTKLNLLHDDEAEQFLLREDTQEKLKDLFTKEDGSPRFYLMEERDGKLENIKKLIEKMIISCGCKIIVIDPIQDLFAGLSINEQEEFSAWLKVTIKAYGVCFVCINHIRKAQGGGTEARYSETEVKGSSTIIQSSFLTILLNREKDPDPTLSKNEQRVLMSTMTHRVSKNRATGETGDAGDLFYDAASHTLYDIEEYKTIDPELFAVPQPTQSDY